MKDRRRVIRAKKYKFWEQSPYNQSGSRQSWNERHDALGQRAAAGCVDSATQAIHVEGAATAQATAALASHVEQAAAAQATAAVATHIEQAATAQATAAFSAHIEQAATAQVTAAFAAHVEQAAMAQATAAFPGASTGAEQTTAPADGRAADLAQQAVELAQAHQRIRDLEALCYRRLREYEALQTCLHKTQQQLAQLQAVLPLDHNSRALLQAYRANPISASHVDTLLANDWYREPAACKGKADTAAGSSRRLPKCPQGPGGGAGGGGSNAGGGDGSGGSGMGNGGGLVGSGGTGAAPLQLPPPGYACLHSMHGPDGCAGGDGSNAGGCSKTGHGGSVGGGIDNSGGHIGSGGADPGAPRRQPPPPGYTFPHPAQGPVSVDGGGGSSSAGGVGLGGGGMDNSGGIGSGSAGPGAASPQQQQQQPGYAFPHPAEGRGGAAGGGGSNTGGGGLGRGMDHSGGLNDSGDAGPGAAPQHLPPPGYAFPHPAQNAGGGDCGGGDCGFTKGGTSLSNAPLQPSVCGVAAPQSSLVPSLSSHGSADADRSVPQTESAPPQAPLAAKLQAAGVPLGLVPQAVLLLLRQLQQQQQVGGVGPHLHPALGAHAPTQPGAAAATGDVPAAPKKPMHAYARFIQANAGRMREWGAACGRDHHKVMSERWKQMSEEEKRPYLLAYEADMLAYGEAKKAAGLAGPKRKKQRAEG